MLKTSIVLTSLMGLLLGSTLYLSGRSQALPATDSPVSQNSGQGKNTAFLKLKFTRDFVPETRDRQGKWMAGTETNYIVAHKGKLWASVSYLPPDRSGQYPPNYTGSMILTKPAFNAPWQVDVALGTEYPRAESMKSITFKTDRFGQKLASPVTLLLVGATRSGGRGQNADVGVWVRDDASGQWSRTVLTDQNLRGDGSRNSGVRVFAEHFDRETGIDRVFAALSKGAIYSGAYDAKTGKILWDTNPEFDGARKRIHAFAEANGVLYATVGVDPKNPIPGSGGLFRRVDGPQPRWQWIYQWQWSHPRKDYPNPQPGMRGLTAIADPKGGRDQVLLGAREHPGVIERIDPQNNYKVTQELDVRQYFAKNWPNYDIYAVSLIAYNEFTAVVDPDTGEKFYLAGLWVRHPSGRRTPLGKSSWYLVRYPDATYAYGRVFDPDHPSERGLLGTRTICPSPFPEDKGRVFYFGGYDVAGGWYADSAWIYRAVLPPRNR